MTSESLLDDISFSVDFEDDYSNEQEFERDTQFLLRQDLFHTSKYPYPLLANRWRSYTKETAKLLGKRSHRDEGSHISTGQEPESSRSSSAPPHPFPASQQHFHYERKRFEAIPAGAFQSDPRPRKKQKLERRTDYWADRSFDYAEAEYQDVSYSRFDPRFLTVKLKGGHELRQRIESAVSTFSHHLLLSRFQSFLGQPKSEGFSGQLCLDLKDLFDKLGRVLYGSDRVRTVVSYQRKIPGFANVLKDEDFPGLVLKGTGDRTLDGRRLEQLELRSQGYWTHVKMAGEIRQSEWSDGNSHGGSAMESPIPSMLRHMVSDEGQLTASCRS